MAIDGHRSAFPAALDDWGAAYENNVCQLWTAQRWNWIMDAVYAAERQAYRLVICGDDRTRCGTDPLTRPRLLVKTFVATIAAPAAEVKLVAMPAFTAAEKALFDGTPLSLENGIVLQARFLGARDVHGARAYLAGISSPLTDPTGDTGWSVALSTMRDAAGDTNLNVGPGSYAITVMINR